MSLRRMVSGLVGALALGMAAGAHADPVNTPHLTADLVAQTRGAAPGSVLYLALRQRIIPGWHTYWRNPGDSGQATEIKWALPAGWRAGEIVWPVPERDVEGPPGSQIVNYVLSNTVLLPVPIEVPADARPGSTAHVTARARWLVCKDVCVPEQGDLAIDVPVLAGTPAQDPQSGAAIARTLADAPKAAGLNAVWRAEGSTVKLAVTGAEVRGLTPGGIAHAWFFPYDGSVLDHSGPQKAMWGPDGVTLDLPAGVAFTNHKPVSEISGVLSLGGGRAWEVTAKRGALPAGAAGLGAPAPTTAQAGGSSGSGGNGAGATTLLGAAALAFVGGLILNLMPCVLPVLSIKAAALARHVQSPGAARAEGLAFLVGVVATFVLLAGLLLGARAAGQAVGWGFQLQSPGVVAVLCLVMLGVALNLSGVFELGASAQGAGSGLAAKPGLAGAFFTGALAVVVAAPCTAPFMAGAVGWAVTQSPPAALLVFLALALGLAAPFTALSFAPGLFKRLPKPGAWMEGLRKFLAFPMYAASAWLAWVFVLQAGDGALPALFAAAVVLAFAVWLWGAAQRGAGPILPRATAGVALAAAAALVVVGVRSAAPAQAGAVAGPVAKGALPAEAWSPERVAALQAEGRPVFVDFTAAWCVTCQVNERTALAGRKVADAFTRTHAAYLKADWTSRDARIARALTAQGRSGVPLYLLYAAEGGAPRVLPQLLTEGGVVAALNTAAGPHS